MTKANIMWKDCNTLTPFENTQNRTLYKVYKTVAKVTLKSNKGKSTKCG